MWLSAKCNACGCDPNSYTGLDYQQHAKSFEFCPECGSLDVIDVFEDYSEYDDVEDNFSVTDIEDFCSDL